MRKNLDVGLLHAMAALVGVIDAGSFTAAAAQLGLTTSQVSRLISQLESRLGVKLLQRTTRSLALTGAGERYVERCREVLNLVEEAEDETMGETVGPRGQLRVSCMANFGSRYVLPLVSAYCEQYPEVSFQYRTSQNLPDLSREGIDLAVYLAKDAPESGNVACNLGMVFSVLCAAPSYLATHEAPDRPADLAGHSCLRVINEGAGRRWELTDGSVIHTLDPLGRVTGDSPEVIVCATLRGAGIALLPTYLVADACRSGRLVHVLPGWQTPGYGVFALVPFRRYLEAKTRLWLRLLKDRIPDALVRDRIGIFLGNPNES
jgi:DNA-binding transcriptional LysR family regulator